LGRDALSRNPRDELAEARTDLAEDRTLLANERTFAGWLRTGMAAVGIGLGFNILFRMLQPPWVPKTIATIFLLIAIFIFVAAERGACAVNRRLSTHAVRTFKNVNLRLITAAMVVATGALIAATWMLV
jgi:putative membrane protein